MMLERHYDDEALISLMETDRLHSDAHLPSCTSCSEKIETFRILEASDGVEALSVFRAHAAEIGIIVTDQRMPNETGVGFLSKISDQWPDVVKILSTAYSDLDAAISSVNK